MNLQKDSIEFFKSKTFTWMVIGIGVLITILLIFEAGVAVGMHKARFDDRFHASYGQNGSGQNFGRAGRSPFGPTAPGDHGAAGTIVSVALPNITVADVSGTEKTVSIGTDTIIRQGDATLLQTDLKAGMRIVVFGEPNEQSIITAKFIRILSDQPPTAPNASEENGLKDNQVQ